MELLKEKLVLVTGAGRGLGAAISSGAAEQGARVILVDIDGTAAKAQADALTAKGFVAEGHALDVTDRDAVAALADDILSRFGGLDVLVNNAGVAGRAAFDQPEAVEVWDRVIGVNLEGAFNVSHALVPALKAAKGNVVHLCSVAGFVSGGSTAGYVVSKGAIRSLTQVMARDLAPHGIRVNAVAPGIMMSEMAVAQLNRPGGTDWFMNRVMMKRIGETSEVVGPVVFLASPMASYITGTILPVDGGFLAA
ncbi:SDR family NAD(P)-dependent oxidoreductase [Brucella melitensis]|uniref:SDR family NAD(P)-dependent oxidoreductase n=1 Tax=Brucella melitensis TaxID=29459 RepID=UPI00050CE820|nr:SDR family NAD(P)-dependent oxidoreductase [Brucella melitensis]AOG50892.1 3-oxoacyl-ACP reductase [Brucella melitensis]ARY25791.1 3-oxoacyl-ACP reductase [Brucella melitensis]ARY28944.1 3-oxoacyl-ACP reductase [Brucella melitensis]ARY38434.1 3-oxoacyl-ACP reductase [Brucella melitensis]KKO93479.1 3-oxoacyl-ACP reductase [Brucella melitensis]